MFLRRSLLAATAAFTCAAGTLPAVASSDPSGPAPLAMTWAVQETREVDGLTYVRVGASGRTDPYRGDTRITTRLPVLCIAKSADLTRPAFIDETEWVSPGGALHGSWSSGVVFATKPVLGTQLTSRKVANEFCRRQAAGHGYTTGALGQPARSWRMAEFHDGDQEAGWAGWDFYALRLTGNPEGFTSSRFWTAINNQPANPWN